MKFSFLTSFLSLSLLESSTQVSAAAPPPGASVKKAFVPQKKTVEPVQPHHQVSLSDDLNAIVDKELIDDIEMLSSMLSTIVKRENPQVYDLYTQLRKHGIDRAADPNNTEAFEKMKQLSFDISPHDAFGIMRVFSVALNLVNAAEVHHRLRVMRKVELDSSGNEESVGPLPMVTDGARGTFNLILEQDGGSKEDIYRSLLSQKVEIVITAHPTEGEKIVLHYLKSLIDAFHSCIGGLFIHDMVRAFTPADSDIF
jgi:hypothetical protein